MSDAANLIAQATQRLAPIASPSVSWMAWARIAPRLRYRVRRWVYRTLYLRSRHWEKVRSAWWRSHPYVRCGYCAESWGRMDLHHLTYANIGAERSVDLVPLHRSCHARVHH